MTNEEAIRTAEQHVHDILAKAVKHDADKKTVVVSDDQCELAIILMEAYKRCLPNAQFIDFYSVSPEAVTETFNKLSPDDLVVLIQSGSFRLNAFRLRVELFEKSLKVIEHPHLARMGGDEALLYIDSLAYDPAYLHGVGHALKARIDTANMGVVESGNQRLLFASPFESAKLNIGDYSQMKNVGGQFPIGEVFTEAKDLEAVSGKVNIFAFGDITFSVYKTARPITLVVEKGRVTNVENSLPEFDVVLENIRADEGEIWLRELGFGLNRAFTKDRIITDIGTYERMCGVHLSLGAKHSVYKKPGFTRKSAKHHVDVFVDTSKVYLDDVVIFENNEWCINKVN